MQARPDVNAAHMTHHTNPLRALQSQDSMGREWDAALGAGDDGMISLLQGQAGGEGFYDYFRGIGPSSSGNIPSSQGSFQFDSDAFTSSQPTLPTLLSSQPIPSQPMTGFRHSPPLPLDLSQGSASSQLHTPVSISPAQLNSLAGDAYPFAYPTPAPTLPGQYAEFRPDSAAGSGPHGAAGTPGSSSRGEVHSASASGSEYSYSATDRSGTDHSEGEDHDMADSGTGRTGTHGISALDLGRMGLKGEKTWTQYDEDEAGGGRSKGKHLGVGPVRRSAEKDDRHDKLEHRRSINRKSAQKHRARRKEELEVLTLAIAERDARISALERDLAVERAKSAQLMEFVKAGGPSPSPPVASSNTRGDMQQDGTGGSGLQSAEISRRSSTRNRKEQSAKIYGDGRDAGW